MEIITIMKDCMKKETSAFIDSSRRIEGLCKKAIQLIIQIILICGGPFSGKRRQGRELARKLAACDVSSYCFQIDLPFELDDSGEEPIEASIITFVLEEMKNHGHFVEEIKELQRSRINLNTFCKFFLERTRRESKFVFVFYDADVVVQYNKQGGFLNFLEKWTEKCKHVFVILTTQFQYTIYRNCLTYCCEPLETEDAIIFLKNEIQITRDTSPNSTIEDPSKDKCKELVELVKCWPFLVMVVARELADFSADEMVELLTNTPLLTLSNEAASQNNQLNYKMQSMVDQLSDGLKMMTSFFAPDVGKRFTVEDMRIASQYKYKSTADARQGCLQCLKIRSLLERPTSDLNMYELIDFMDEHVADNALDSFQPSAVKKNDFLNMIVNLVTISLKNAVKGSEDEVQRCRQQAAPECKEMVSQMKKFDSEEHSEAQQMLACEKIIQAADDFLKRATKQTDMAFRTEANRAKVNYCKSISKRTVSQDSAIQCEDNSGSENNSGSELEEPFAPVTISGGASEGNILARISASGSPCSLKSDVDIIGLENPLQQKGVYQEDAGEAQSRYPQGPQSTALVQDLDVPNADQQESSDGNNGEQRIVPSGCNSIPLNGTRPWLNRPTCYYGDE